MNINWIQKLKIAIAAVALLGLTACGGAGGGGGGSGAPSPATQAGVVVPVSMGGFAIVGQPYKGMVQVAPKDSTSTVTSLSIANNTAGGAQPSIDSAGNVVWIPNDQDFAVSPASLRVTGQLSNGTTVADNVPMDVRKERVILQNTLDAIERTYTDVDGQYVVQVSKKTPASVIAGAITITETYRKNGEFSWDVIGTGSGYTTTVIQAPITAYTPLLPSTTITPTQIGVTQQAGIVDPITKLTTGINSPYFSDISDDGGVLKEGTNVYTSRTGSVSFSDSSRNIIIQTKSLGVFKAFWFGSNCNLGGQVTAPLHCQTMAQTKSPVILIHGFSGTDNMAALSGYGNWFGGNESITGGGIGTWGQTADLLTKQGYPVFEMKWLSYMPFEDAAGALAKFGKDIATVTGKKPIILAHSFGGVVSHLALQNKGREYIGGAWQPVNSNNVFAKLVSLNSPLSGINADGTTTIGDPIPFNSTKKVKGVDVAFPRGVDMDDKSIYKCYSITCVQAGAVFAGTWGSINNNYLELALNKAQIDGNIPDKGSQTADVIASELSSGETIVDIQTGIAQAADNAPFITVVGFRNFLGNVGRLGFPLPPNSLYELGDGLISLLGQAAIPQDFSASAFDANSSPAFKFYFESNQYPRLGNTTGTLATTEKGDCIEYSNVRNYLICPFSAHTDTKIIGSWSSSLTALSKIFDIKAGFDNFYIPLPLSTVTKQSFLYGTSATQSEREYAIASFDGNISRHPMWKLVFSTKYLAMLPTASQFAIVQSQTATVRGRLLAGSTPVNPVRIFYTICEKLTCGADDYRSAGYSDANGNFNFDFGGVIASKYGVNAVLANYRIKLKVDAIGYKSWIKTIDTIIADTNLGDIDLSKPLASIAVVTPTTATIGAATTLTVTGTNLPLTAVLSMADAVCQTPTNRAASGFTVSCTPQGTATGVKVITVKTDTLANGGTVIDAKWTVTVSATQPVIPTNGLVAYYPFDNDVHDASGNFNNGLIGGSVAFVSGIVGNGAKFNGIRSAGGGQVPDHVLVPNSTSLQFTNAMTISYWVRIDGNQSQTNADCSGAAVTSIFGTVVAKSGDRNGFVLNEFDTGSSLQINPWSGGLGLNNGNTVLSSVYGTFRHVAYVVNGNTASQYINGVLVSSATGLVDFMQPNTRDLYIGASFNRGGACLDFWGQLDGVVDELRIYNRALSTQEIQGVFTFR